MGVQNGLVSFVLSLLLVFLAPYALMKLTFALIKLKKIKISGKP